MDGPLCASIQLYPYPTNSCVAVPSNRSTVPVAVPFAVYYRRPLGPFLSPSSLPATVTVPLDRLLLPFATAYHSHAYHAHHVPRR